MRGIFDLSGPADLVAKLGRELERLRADPANADHAFNFFVTAEHITDWLHPSDGEARRALRDSDALLKVVSHLASGAKHFDYLQARHRSVKASERWKGGIAPTWAPITDPPGWFPIETPIPPRLVVHLDGAAGAEYGATIDALALAEEVFRYWSAPGRVPS